MGRRCVKTQQSFNLSKQIPIWCKPTALHNGLERRGQPVFTIRRIGEDDVIRLIRPAPQKTQDIALSHTAPICHIQCIHILVQALYNLRLTLNETDLLGPPAEGFKAQASTSGKQIQNAQTAPYNPP